MIRGVRSAWAGRDRLVCRRARSIRRGLRSSASSRAGSRGRHPRARTPLLTDAPVDSLTQQVGVAVVPAVLLDHVDQKLPQ
jgi:hypothetical protein